MELKTEREVNLLLAACRMTGTDPTKITCENPATKSGKTAQMLMVAAGEIDPEQAARWRQAAPGGQLSVATKGECYAAKRGADLSPAAQQELWEKDPDYVKRRLEGQKGSDEAILAALDKAADELRLKNAIHSCGGNEAEAKRQIAAQDQAEAQRQQQREESERHAMALNQRLEQKRQQARQMAGGIL